MGGLAPQLSGCLIRSRPARTWLCALRSPSKKLLFFELLGRFFFSPNVPSPSRPKCPCTNESNFLRKRGETVGILALSPDRRCLYSHFEPSWCSRSPPELGRVLSKNNGKIRVTFRKTEFLTIPRNENTLYRPDTSLLIGLCRVTSDRRH